MSVDLETIDPYDSTAQEEAVARKADATRLQRQLEVEDLKWLMGHKQGRRYVWRQLQRYGVYRSSFRENPLEIAFLEGARNHGLQLIADIHEHCAERYAEMLKEMKANGRRESSDRSATR
jgi:hypothetical protein